MRTLAIIIFTVISFQGYAQTNLDSLLRIWNDGSNHDTTRLGALYELCGETHKSQPDTAIHYSQIMLGFAERKGSDEFWFKAKSIQAKALIRKNQHNEAVAIYTESLARARSTGSQKDEAEALWNIGEIFSKQAKYQEATEHHKNALRIRTSLKNRLDMANSLNSLGVIYHKRGNLDSAKYYYERSLALLEKLDEPGPTSKCLYNLGLIADNRADYVESIKYYNRSLMVRQKMGETRTLRYPLGAIAGAYRAQGEVEKALEYYHRALEVCIENDDKRGIAVTYNNLSNLYKDQGDLDKSISLLKKSLAIKEQLKDRFGIGVTMVNFGSTYMDAGKFDSAGYYFGSALELFQQLGATEGIARAQSGMAANFVEQGKFREAIAPATQALEIGESIGQVELVKDAAGALYRSYKAIGQAEKSLRMYELHISLLDSIASMDNQRELMRFEYKHAYEKQALTDSLEFSKKEAVLQERTQKQQIGLIAAGGGLLLVLALAFAIYSGKKKSDELLLNILPAETAEELKQKGHSDAKLIDEVTVLFTDFKGFTSLSEQVTPKELVADLHACFSEFDRIMEKYGIEKIKTIGDAYMAAGGLPTPNSTHAQDVVKAALEMADVVEKGKAKKIEQGLPFFEIRIGVHTGPVVAGIVGVKKFQYDIWGDTVNTASRMESSGEVGKVNISEATYELLKDDPQFSFESRGKVQAKGKGEMEMYFVEAKA